MRREDEKQIVWILLVSRLRSWNIFGGSFGCIISRIKRLTAMQPVLEQRQ